MTYGPVDFLVLEFQTNNLKGEILPALLDLVENQTIRVIDLVIIQKNANGIHQALEMNQVGPDLLGVFDPLKVEVSGMIQIEDIQRIAEEMEDGTNVAILMFENLWAIKFKDAVLKANGKLLEQVRIPHEQVEESMAVFASAEQPA